MSRRLIFYILGLTFAISLFFSGCSSGKDPDANAAHDETARKETSPDDPGETKPARDNTPDVLAPKASGDTVYASDIVSIDASNTEEGYVMVRYSGTNKKVKLLIVTPAAVTYTYLLRGGDYEAFPLTGEDGTYQMTVYENIKGDSYAAVFSQSVDVSDVDPFKPYLYPNQYVTFTADSEAVELAEDLAQGADDDLDVVAAVYNYVITHITYDTRLAENVSYGYLPDVDATLDSGKGICFDYAALMTAMLRSQRIPTRLEVGYSDDLYHAWISTYVDEIGWIDNVIQFDGKSWSLMDPTLAANNSAENVREYVGEGGHYTVKYTY